MADGTARMLITVKNPETQKMIDRIMASAIRDPSEPIYPMFFQPTRGKSNTVSAAIRALKKEGLIVQDGLNGIGRPIYKVTGKALDLYHGVGPDASDQPTKRREQ